MTGLHTLFQSLSVILTGCWCSVSQSCIFTQLYSSYITKKAIFPRQQMGICNTPIHSQQRIRISVPRTRPLISLAPCSGQGKQGRIPRHSNKVIYPHIVKEISVSSVSEPIQTSNSERTSTFV